MRNVIPRNAVLIPPRATRAFHGIIFDVYQWRQEMFDGSFETFEMLKRPDTVQVIAVKNDKIVVLEEAQPGRPPFIGIPGGRHDQENESELDAAKRELLEETGLTFSSWKLLDVTQPQPKMDYFAYRFLATDLASAGEPAKDHGEEISMKFMDFAEVKTIAEGTRSRPMANEIFRSVSSVEELLALPEYTA
jgi:ADP-ribose pyrophosphatase